MPCRGEGGCPGGTIHKAQLGSAGADVIYICWQCQTGTHSQPIAGTATPAQVESGMSFEATRKG